MQEVVTKAKKNGVGTTDTMRKISVILLSLIVFLMVGCGRTQSTTEENPANNHVSESGNAQDDQNHDKETDYEGVKDIEEESNHEKISEDTEDVNATGSSDNQDTSNVEETISREDAQQQDQDGPGATDTQGNWSDTDTQVNPDDSSNQGDSESTNQPLIINLTDVDGRGTNYIFTYDGEEYRAEYTTPENWKIYDSYLINSESDMLVICQALIDEHPIHGKDMVSYRTAEDMVYEWQIHNLSYAFLEDDDPYKDDCKDVDFDPKDQGLTIDEFYESRTGQNFDLEKIFGAEP